MIVAVTGANGFIGSHLVEDQLRRGREVRAIDLSFSRLLKYEDEPQVSLAQVDIRDAAGMDRVLEGCDLVFHLASAHLSLCLSENDYWAINRDASRRLVEQAHRLGVPGFIHCSTVGVQGEIKRPPASEDSPFHPDLIYERSKLEGERLVREYAADKDYPCIVLRPVWVYGPGCPRTEKLIRMVRKRRFFYLGSPNVLRHCLFIDDMVRAFNVAAERLRSTVPGRVFIIGDRQAVTLRELMGEIAAVVGQSPPKVVIPLWLGKPGVAAIESLFKLLGKEPPVSRRSLKFFSNKTSFTVARAREELGFEARYSLKEGLSLTYSAMEKSRSEEVEKLEVEYRT